MKRIKMFEDDIWKNQPYIVNPINPEIFDDETPFIGDYNTLLDIIKSNTPEEAAKKIETSINDMLRYR